MLAAAPPAAWGGHDRGGSGYRRVLIGLFCAGIATFAQLYSPQGLLPLVARDLGVRAADAALTISAPTIGLAVSVLFWSAVADRIGRLPTMRISLIAATVFGLAVAFWPTFEGVLVLRALEGAALGGLPAIAMTYLGEEISRRHAAVAAGTYVSGTTLGGLVGRIVAAPIGDLAGWRVGVATVAVLAAAATVVFVLVVPRARGFARPDAGAAPHLGRAVLANLRDPGVRMLLGQGFLLMGGFVAVYNYLTFRLEAPPFGLTPAVASLLFVAYLGGTVSSRVAGSLASARGRTTVLVGSTGVMAAGVALTLAPSLPVVVVGLVVLTAGFFAAHAVASGWIGLRAPTGRAQASSLYNLGYYAGSSLLGWAGGLAFGAVGWSGVAAGVLACCALAVAWALLDARRTRA